MPISKAQQKAVTKYVKEKYDRFSVTMPKGQKEKLMSHANSMGDSSLNAFINRAIQETMERDISTAEGAHE